MVRSTCHILGCKSKKSKDNHITFFKVPKNKITREKWIEAIGDRLALGVSSEIKNILLCEKHFTSDCFLKDYMETLADGALVQIKRRRKALKRNVIPSNFPEYTKPRIYVQRIRELSPNSKHKANVRGNLLDIQDTYPVSNPRECSVRHIRDLSPNSKHKANIRGNLLNIQETCLVSKNRESSETLKNELYTIDDLMKDWHQRNKNMFPIYWEMQETPEDELVFFYLGDDPLQVVMSRSIFITKEMDAEIRVYEHRASYDVIDKVRCFEDLRYAICILTSVEICKFAKLGKCRNGFFVGHNAYAKRCHECQLKNRRCASVVTKRKKKEERRPSTEEQPIEDIVQIDAEEILSNAEEVDCSLEDLLNLSVLDTEIDDLEVYDTEILEDT